MELSCLRYVDLADDARARTQWALFCGPKRVDEHM